MSIGLEFIDRYRRHHFGGRPATNIAIARSADAASAMPGFGPLTATGPGRWLDLNGACYAPNSGSGVSCTGRERRSRAVTSDVHHDGVQSRGLSEARLRAGSHVHPTTSLPGVFILVGCSRFRSLFSTTLRARQGEKQGDADPSAAYSTSGDRDGAAVGVGGCNAWERTKVGGAKEGSRRLEAVVAFQRRSLEPHQKSGQSTASLPSL